MTKCFNCAGSRWVCENHPDKPWPEGCDCGAGMSCPVCSAELSRDGAIEAFLSNCDREDLNALRATPLDDEPEELEHFMTCPECGQSFDMRRLGDAIHHNEPGHKPLRTNA